jgi:hypothetical protein
MEAPMLETLLTKENVALGLASALLVWRIVDVIFRQRKRREHELERLAFDITKVAVSDDPFGREKFFPYYLMYLDALERDMRPYTKDGAEVMNDYFDQMTKRLDRLDMIRKNLEGLEEKLKDNHQVTLSDLFHRNLTWGHWWEETRMLLKRTLKMMFKRRFHSTN